MNNFEKDKALRKILTDFYEALRYNEKHLIDFAPHYLLNEMDFNIVKERSIDCYINTMSRLRRVYNNIPEEDT